MNWSTPSNYSVLSDYDGSVSWTHLLVFRLEIWIQVSRATPNVFKDPLYYHAYIRAGGDMYMLSELRNSHAQNKNQTSLHIFNFADIVYKINSDSVRCLKDRRNGNTLSQLDMSRFCAHLDIVFDHVTG